jgi:hypothetical protein
MYGGGLRIGEALGICNLLCMCVVCLRAVIGSCSVCKLFSIITILLSHAEEVSGFCRPSNYWHMKWLVTA